MTELTEKLKQGNLKDGYYYAKMPTGCVDVVSLYNLRQLRLAKDGDKIEVLDIVPDYYQFQNICKCLSEEHRGNYNLMIEIEELKKYLEMLQNSKNVTENVANQKVQHCEKYTRIKAFFPVGKKG